MARLRRVLRAFFIVILCLVIEQAFHALGEETASTCIADGAGASSKMGACKVTPRPDGTAGTPVADVDDDGSLVRRPCGCDGKMSTKDLLLCAGQMAPEGPSPAKPDERILAISHIPPDREKHMRYGFAITAANLAAFGHGLRCDRRLAFHGSEERAAAYRDRSVQAKLLLEVVKEAAKQNTSSIFGWLLWIDADTAIVSDEDVLRQALHNESVDNKTHIIVCRHGRKGKLLDSGAVMLKNAPWTEGFLMAWLQELSLPGSEPADADLALERAVQRARGLGGVSAVVELPAGALSADLREYAYASVHSDPIVRLIGDADEVRADFLNAVWTWACFRPGGLGGRSPAVLQRLHLQALERTARELGARLPSLHRGGRVVARKDYGGALFDALAGYAPVLRSHASVASNSISARVDLEKAVQVLLLCTKGYQAANEDSKAQECERIISEVLASLAARKSHRGAQEQSQ